MVVQPPNIYQNKRTHFERVMVRGCDALNPDGQLVFNNDLSFPRPWMAISGVMYRAMVVVVNVGHKSMPSRLSAREGK